MKTIRTYVNGRDNKVNLIFNFGGKRLMIATGFSSPVKFSGTEVPRSVPGSRVLTLALRRWYSECEEYILLHPDLPCDIMKSALRSIINGVSPCEPQAGDRLLVDLLRAFSEEKKAESTRKLYLCTARNVERFDSRAMLSTVDASWLSRYAAHEEQKPLRGSGAVGRMVNGIGIDLRNIRAVFNWAITNEWTERYPFRRFKIHSEPTRKRNLPIDHCRAIMRHGSRYSDTFMLMLFLIGINISDLYYLPADCIKDGRLEYRRNKTGRFFSILVEPEAMSLIERYRGEIYLLNYAETCSNYKDFLKHMNYELKRLYDGCTSYWSRHTWASMAAWLDVPIETISAALGHSVGASVTNIYVNWDHKKVDSANRRVIDWVMYGKK